MSAPCPLPAMTALLLALGVTGPVIAAEVPVDVDCSATGAPPMPLAPPASVPIQVCHGRVLSFEQAGLTRYACFDLPNSSSDGRPRPLVIYLHGSRTVPDTLYRFGAALVDLHESYSLGEVPGFAILAVEGRRAQPAESLTGKGFHWDEWHRDPVANLDALAIDHFLDEALAGGKVDPRRIYVMGWSNGAFMAALYGVWRGSRVAGIAEYAGGDPWSRSPCPVPFTFKRKVPLVLLRNACDSLVPYASTVPWMQALQKLDWPVLALDLDVFGHVQPATRAAAADCGTLRGDLEHVRWPDREALQAMLAFWKDHPLAPP